LTVPEPLAVEGEEPARVLDDRQIVLDCRWLGLGGAGSVTEMLLQEFRAEPPAGRWTCWGDPDRIRPLAFAGAEVASTTRSPLSLAGQRDLLRVPRADIVLYMHQIRPFRRGRSVTVIYDTIPLRYGGRLLTRLGKRAFFLMTAAFSTRVLTTSEFSQRQVTRDLRVRAEAIDVMRLPVDLERAKQIVELRERLPLEPTLLYVGRFAAHKNVERLCLAFAGSRFAADGGRLVLVGGWGDEVAALRTFVRDSRLDGVEVRPVCTREELDRLLATSRALIAPSLEEGYGLPPFEAAAAGLPVAVSPTGAMTGLPAEVATSLDPYDVEDIRRAIDEVTTKPHGSPRAVSVGNVREVVLASLAACFTESR
jgi:glycosyltransferase involved in cell wall biosynthesis